MTQHNLEQVVAAGYDRVADAYEALERPEAPWPRRRWLAELTRRLPAGSRVLDLGCGNGSPVAAMLAESYRVTGVDVSPEQITRARRGVPAAEFILADLLDLSLPAGAFDAVTAFYTIDHLPRHRWAELFARVATWLRPGGLLLLTAETEDQPGVVGQWLGTPMFFSSYDPQTTRKLLAGTGFEVVRDAVETQQEGDKPVEYLWVLARQGGGGKVPPAIGRGS